MEGSTPSPTIKVVLLMWSVITRIEMSFCASALYSTPTKLHIFFIMFCTVSTSKRLSTSCITHARRSRPMPVSIFFVLSWV